MGFKVAKWALNGVIKMGIGVAAGKGVCAEVIGSGGWCRSSGEVSIGRPRGGVSEVAIGSDRGERLGMIGCEREQFGCHRSLRSPEMVAGEVARRRWAASREAIAVNGGNREGQR
ncbi:hypothetical protein U1Q18_013386 [Sarracenia purpurea var. burkii]